jgi:hypothetical protein
MRDAIGRPSASFLADGLTTTTQQRIPQRRTPPLRLGVCSPGAGGVSRGAVGSLHDASLGHHVVDSRAPFGAVKPLASLDPFGATGLDRSLPAPWMGIYVMAGTDCATPPT